MFIAKWLNQAKEVCGYIIAEDEDDLRRLIATHFCKGESWHSFGRNGDSIIVEQCEKIEIDKHLTRRIPLDIDVERVSKVRQAYNAKIAAISGVATINSDEEMLKFIYQRGLCGYEAHFNEGES